MDEILGIVAPASLLLLGFGIMGFLLLRDRRDRRARIHTIDRLPGQVVEMRESSKG